VPVVVTGASGPVGRALVPRLVAAGSEVRAVVRRQEAAESLRALGAKVAVGDAANPELLPTVLRDAHTLCHVVDGLFLEEDQYFSVIAGTTQATVEAAKEAELARVLFLSYPGADPGSPNAYLRAKGMAEQAVLESGLEHLILRSTLVLGRESQWVFLFGAWSTRTPFIPLIGPGTQRMAPVFVEDAASVLAAADDRAQPVSGTLGLQGPDTVTADQFADLLAGRQRRKVHPPEGWRVFGNRRDGSGRNISRSAAQVLASDSLADAPDAAAEFGVRLTPLKEALGASGLSPV
jgi:uncharacterized protein YbjT (DUF2867 family)